MGNMYRPSHWWIYAGKEGKKIIEHILLYEKLKSSPVQLNFSYTHVKIVACIWQWCLHVLTFLCQKLVTDNLKMDCKAKMKTYICIGLPNEEKRRLSIYLVYLLTFYKMEQVNARFLQACHSGSIPWLNPYCAPHCKYIGCLVQHGFVITTEETEWGQ